MRTDRQTDMTNLIVVFLNFPSVPKIECDVPDFYTLLFLDGDSWWQDLTVTKHSVAMLFLSSDRTLYCPAGCLRFRLAHTLMRPHRE
jgi:hypothetical protein